VAGIGELSRMCSAGACRVISYDISESGQTVILIDAVVGHLDHHRQRTPGSREAGGQLFARFDGNAIQVERTTGPRPSDRRRRMSFIPDRLAERREIKRLFREGLCYVGDWHTHPEPCPIPSQTDIDSFQDMFRKSRHRLASFVMVIVGTADPPTGLFVALCNSEGVRKLAVSRYGT